MKILATVFSLGSLACEFQTVYILLSVGGSTLTFYLPELIEKLHRRALEFCCKAISTTLSMGDQIFMETASERLKKKQRLRKFIFQH